MVRRIRTNKKAFTLIETITASVIICAAALALGAISTRSLSQTKHNRQYEVAMTCLDRQLTIIDYIGIDDFLEMGQTEGKFSQYEPQVRWELYTSPTDLDKLYMVKLTVSWTERGKIHSISAETLMNSRTGSLELMQIQ